MRITVDDTYYCKSVNLPVGLRKRLSYILDVSWPWALTFVMFFILAVLALRTIPID
jgi:hypothetical protein